MIEQEDDQLDVSLFEMIMCLSDAMDLVSTVVNGHHKRVAYIATTIAKEFGLSAEEQRHITIAGALHDVGAFSLQDRLNALEFEILDYSEELGLSKHAELGYCLIKNFEPFYKIAPLIRYHHLYWGHGAGREFCDHSVPLASHILHLADRIEVLLDTDREILGQVAEIKEDIAKRKGEQFHPQLVAAFNQVAGREAFWFDIISGAIDHILAEKLKRVEISLNLTGLHDLAKLFSQIIDFRSRFTASHSSGVAAVATKLANYAGLSTYDQRVMKVAGYLHDLGKLAVPPEILEKKGGLTDKEFNIMKQHVYYTYHTLDRVEGLARINQWAALHHERINGQGYPFHYQDEDLSLGSRIMAVADVFTAISEDRPYRAGMDKEQILDVLEDMVANRGLDEELVTLLVDNFQQINKLRQRTQQRETEEYKDFLRESN
ncbi:MAG: HD-GYP domain-containing protein [Bacillota bacterium]